MRIRSGKASARGQGVIEFVLLLVVIVVLALLLANKFFSPFKKWSDYHLGTYVECLLDEGVLPSLGGGDGGPSECGVAPGFDGGGASGGGGTAGGGANQRDRDPSGRNRLNQNNQSANSSDSGGSQSGGRSRRIGMGGIDGGGNTDSSRRTVGNANEGGGGGGRVRIVRLGGGNLYRTGQGRIQRATGLEGLLTAEREKIKRREAKSRAVRKLSGDESAQLNQSRRIAVKETARKPRDVSLSESDWSIGKMVRIVFIILIIIALVLFVGGQLVQISKSAEK